MVNQEAYLVHAHITHRNERVSGVIVTENGELPKADFFNSSPEVNKTDESLARTLARRALSDCVPSFQRAKREPGSAIFYFVVEDQDSATPTEGHRWYTEPTESAVDA